ncbi:hypothetical protein [Roseospirillum parvum]|uniref:hypothetical protein n=1 Tax=Roseospirillum parvum TaxID=83401 RepID=UPI001160E036|nr:hypothetical protein [Roseospirillum parvum]
MNDLRIEGLAQVDIQRFDHLRQIEEGLNRLEELANRLNAEEVAFLIGVAHQAAPAWRRPRRSRPCSERRLEHDSDVREGQQRVRFSRPEARCLANADDRETRRFEELKA